MEPITLHIKTAAGGKHTVAVPVLDETVAAFKTRLSPIIGIDADAQRIIFRGHVLKDDWTLQRVKDTHGLENGHTMHIIRAARPASGQAPTSQGIAQGQPGQNAQASRTSTASVPGTIPFSMFGAGGPRQGVAPAPNTNNFNNANGIAGNNNQNNPIASMMDMMGGGGGVGGVGVGNGTPDMAEMQRLLMQNPEQMQAMLNSPMMDSLMNNPELARSLMMANPQVRELIERNPEVAHVLNDSATFRQMMQMARNPSLMNEMMRSTDRQMANIEMMPGGFDALRRMHENIQAPLMDATAGGLGGMIANGNADQGSDNGSNRDNDNPFMSLFQPQNNTPSNAPMPNPWAPNRGIPANRPNSGTTASNGVAGAAPPMGSSNNMDSNNIFASLFQNANAQQGNPAGFDGHNSAGFGGAPGLFNMNQDQMYQMLENPMVQSMMETVLGDPATLETMIASNPQLQAMINSNPAMANMLRDPATLRTFLNPTFMRAMMQMRGTMDGAQAGTGSAPHPTTPSGTATGGNTGSAPNAAAFPDVGTGQNTGTFGYQARGQQPEMNQLLQMMGGLQAGMGDTTAQPEAEMTQEQLEPQLAQLRDMGFLDTSMCLQALRQSRGNVNLAVEHLLSRFS